MRSEGAGRMERRFVRRRFVGALVAAVATMFGAGQARAEETTIQEYCSWKRYEGPRCRTDHAVGEYWCYECCDMSGCWTSWCEWRVVGTC